MKQAILVPCMDATSKYKSRHVSVAMQLAMFPPCLIAVAIPSHRRAGFIAQREILVRLVSLDPSNWSAKRTHTQFHEMRLWVKVD